jgi:hypothetical protein
MTCSLAKSYLPESINIKLALPIGGVSETSQFNSSIYSVIAIENNGFQLFASSSLIVEEVPVNSFSNHQISVREHQLYVSASN